MADTLEPIVIPPLQVEKHFTCSGTGLRYENEERVSVESLRTLLLPSGGRNGISDRDRSKAWWGGQALFYGLKYTKTMNISQVRAQLENALRDKTLRVPQSILDLEYQYNKEFRELNAQVRDKAGLGTKRKREADPVAPKAAKSKAAGAVVPAAPRAATKTKAEPSPKKPRTKKTNDDPVAVEEAAKPRPKQTAKKLTPAARPQQMDWMEVDVKPVVEAPKPRTKQTARKTTQPANDQWMAMDEDVKPRTKQTARKTMKEEEFDEDDLYGMRTKTTAGRSVPVPAGPVASSSSMPMPAPPVGAKQTARRGVPFPAPPARSTAPRLDSISGYWSIDCPAISNEWDYMDNFSLNIIGRGTTLEGEFELGIISGLLRSDRVEQRGPGGAYAAVYWSGQENDGPVCTPNQGRSGYIKFTGDKLKGKLNNVPACGDVEFEGQWVGGATQIRATWDDYNEDAYERANRNRWGGGSLW
ncbi:hypothetical protein B0H16DRAFT_402647 [Mycena metata]|uniref:Uncharacterized protein n=1 Tax=Mycena metata TaxID=1033252 RepID=A0AAD7JKF5_9AGAR|nr:hypothetical protein B0H16DRAFT_402647 [Mycena metata]